MVSAGAVNVGLVVSLTMIVCTWFCAALLQLSTRLHVRMMVMLQGSLSFTSSTKVASRFSEQLSDSSVTSPVAVTLASYSQLASL